MKKIILASTLIGASLILQSFSNHRTTKEMIDFTELNETNMELIAQSGSFEEYVDNHHTSDKQVFFKRIRYWDVFQESFELHKIERVLNRN